MVKFAAAAGDGFGSWILWLGSIEEAFEIMDMLEDPSVRDGLARAVASQLRAAADFVGSQSPRGRVLREAASSTEAAGRATLDMDLRIQLARAKRLFSVIR